MSACACAHPYIGTRQLGEPERCERCWGLVDDAAQQRLEALYAEGLKRLAGG